jgi:aspartate carbamoyltransferase catalytic subunit
MRDLISIDDLSIAEVEKIFAQANLFLEQINQNKIKQNNQILTGKKLVNFFFENSTRTRTSFEIAAKNLGAEVINIDISLSSLKKGESIIDTATTIDAMKPDFIAIRHNSSGIISLFKKYISASLINAGDGTNEHPSQALLDAFIIKNHKKTIADLNIAICGDVLHSRVARSNIKLLSRMGAKIKIITLPTLMPKDFAKWLYDNWQIEVYQNLSEGIKNVDVIMMLRIQQERMQSCFFSSLAEYYKIYGLNHENIKLAKKDVIVLHPGPINREVEISSNLADDTNFSLITKQVTAGVAVRQAILCFLSEL